MIRNQFVFDLHEELIVDNFAGGGGASTGIELALGRCVDIAINHDAEAIAMHEANHPQTKHFCEDVWQIDPLEAAGGRRVGFAWFSPDCKHFSKAKGGKPRSKKIRGLAWVVVKWAMAFAKAGKPMPRVMMLENVEEFKTWGPLLRDGRPCPKNATRTFHAFMAILTTGIRGDHPDIPEIKRALGKTWDARIAQRGLGYQVETREIRACTTRAATIRKRLYLIARCDGRPIVWPAPTHGDPKSKEVRSKKLKPWGTAADCIDWSIPCRSIFERERPLAEATLRRIARGIRKFVLESSDPFVVSLTHKGIDRVKSIRDSFCAAHITKFYGQKSEDECRAVGADEPLHTQSTENRFGLVNATLAPFLTEHANATHGRVFPIGEPLRTQCAEVKGGHFAAVTAFLAKHFTGVVGSPMEDPVHTVTATDHNSLVTANLARHFGQSIGSEMDSPVGTICAGGGGKTSLVTSHLSKLYGTCTGHDMREPLHTFTSGGNHIAEVRAFFIKYYGNEKEAHSLREPLHTITAKDRIGLVTIKGEDYVISDIGMRMLEPRELYAAQGFPNTYIIAPIVPRKRGKKVINAPLSKSAQVRMCGNSVCPPVAEALVSANVPELCAWDPRELSTKRKAV